MKNPFKRVFDYQCLLFVFKNEVVLKTEAIKKQSPHISLDSLAYGYALANRHTLEEALYFSLHWNDPTEQ